MNCIVLPNDSIIDNEKTFMLEKLYEILSFLRLIAFYSFFFLSINKLYLSKDILSVNIYIICQVDLVKFLLSS